MSWSFSNSAVTRVCMYKFSALYLQWFQSYGQQFIWLLDVDCLTDKERLKLLLSGAGPFILPPFTQLVPPPHKLCQGWEYSFWQLYRSGFLCQRWEKYSIKRDFFDAKFQTLFSASLRISYGVIKCLIGINSKRIHGQSLFYLEGDGGGYDDGGGYNDDDADDDNGDGGGYIQLTIMIATCRSHRGFCAGFAV